MRSPSTRILGPLTWLAITACVLSGPPGCSRRHPAEEDTAEIQHPFPVRAAKAERITLRPTLELVATIIAIPERTALVSSQAGGWIEQPSVVEGQAVRKSDVLVRLDARTAEANQARAKAAVAEKEAALARLKRGYLPQEMEAARQDRDKARATMESLRSEVAALKNLLDRREISPIQYEMKVKMLESADAAYKSADEHVKLLEAGTRPELVQEAQALLDIAKADLEHAELAVRWCTIESPIDGVVVTLQARQGQFIERAVPLATVIDLREVFVPLRIPTEHLSQVREGTAVDVEVPAIPGRRFGGTVTRFSGQADALTGNVDVFATVKNEDGALRPGLGCRARIYLPEIPDALAIPVAAVADHSGTPVVTVIRDGMAYETEVELGIQTTDFVQITKGLSAGDLVATAGGYGLPEGCLVTVVQPESDKH